MVRFVALVFSESKVSVKKKHSPQSFYTIYIIQDVRIKPCSATERTLNVENGDEKFFETLFAEVWHVDTILQKCQERNVQSLETNLFAWLPCSLLPIFDDSPGWFSNGAQWESLRWSQVLLWILWQQQLSRSKLMLVLLFLSSKKTVYRFIAYMMNPRRQSSNISNLKDSYNFLLLIQTWYKTKQLRCMLAVHLEIIIVRV